MTAAVPEPELGVVRNAEFHSMGQTMDDGQSYIFNSSLWSLCICQDKGVPISRLQDLLDLSRRCSSSLLSAIQNSTRAPAYRCFQSYGFRRSLYILQTAFTGTSYVLPEH